MSNADSVLVKSYHITGSQRFHDTVRRW